MSISNRRDKMYINIDGFRQDWVIYNNKNYTKDELKQMYKNALLLTKRELVQDKMCQLYGFEKMLHNPIDNPIEFDYVIDTDIDEIYIPHY